ncbi:ATP-dependent helicase HepA [Plasticicumulans lactativorans]|uniref:RNA polymerase-associated protein RapA n=1 Tax=Plasticicumulans lactativorans TaxID=1133106 RepID=A0A4R2L8J5_9GAMM|nr:RNA polymerase-associated protein RapA [Plasticicumulans lactativorans]TCO83422.1 ATP-dependent helicase HepA [Plasticicumulans lactativorans]
MDEFVGGSRWISETEPELGLGMVLSGDARRVTLLFHGSGEMRQYARAGAPLARVRFQPGDAVHSHEGWSLVVESVEETGGLFTYHGGGRQLPETALSNFISFSKPQDRLFAGQADPAAQFTLRVAALEHQARMRGSDLRGLLGPRIELLPHQLWIAHEVAGRYAPRVLLADEVGLGKTIEAGLILHQRVLTGRSARVLVLVPESLLNQWFLELRRRFNLAFSMFDEARCIAAAQEAGNPFLSAQLVLASIAFLTGSAERLAQAEAAGWDLLIVDEAHHLAWEAGLPSPEYATVERLAARTEGLLLLTATPEQFGEEGHFARLRLLDPDRFHDLDAFHAEQADYRAIARVVDTLLAGQAPGAADAELLRGRLGEATALDALGDADAEQARERLIEQLLDRHGTGRVLFRNSRSALAQFPRRVPHLLALPCPAAYAALAHSPTPERAWQPAADGRPWWRFDPRVDVLLELLEHGDKVLLICARKETAIDLDEALRTRSGVPAALFHEDMPLLARDRAAAWFADRDGARVLLCSEIGSEGRNFQFAQHLVLFDLPADPDLLEQRIGRLDRIGQRGDIHLHVPYLRDTAQEALARWYDEGLDAFARHARAAPAVYRVMAERLHAALGRRDDLAALLADTRALAAELGAALEAGRDRLLERHSYRPQPAGALAARIAAIDADGELEGFMERLFDHFGVDQEEHSEHARVLRPGEALYTAALPGLADEGLTVSFERRRALAREDMEFLSWEHPLVSGAFELLLGSEHGNCALAGWTDAAGDVPEWLVEAVFVLECVAPRALQVDRYLPPQPLRVVLDPHLHLRGDDYPAARLDAATRDLPAAALREPLGAHQRLLRRMLDAAAIAASTLAEQRVQAALTRMQAELTPEAERLRSLAAVNPNVRVTEIEFAETRIAELYRHMHAARPRLDALRVVTTIASPSTT